MKIHDIAFWSASFFLIGVFLESAGLGISISIAAAILAAVLFLSLGYSKKSINYFWLAGLSLVIVAGVFYAFWWNKNQTNSVDISFNRKINFSGIVIDAPKRGNQQEFVVDLQQPYSGEIAVKTRPYPVFEYGDFIEFEGVIREPQPLNYRRYLAKDGIFGTSAFPKTELKTKNQGSKIKSFLFGIKTKAVSVFQKVFAPGKAAFISGITLGERSEFSKEFKEAMAKSGTTHLIALSGYNIAVIAGAASAFFAYFLSRRLTFALTVFTILGFVSMTGAEASVVRAAIMGSIALLAEQVGRVKSMRNAIVLAAFLMVLFNPKILYFDIGFQLSFAALMGIVYLSPAIGKFLKMKTDEGFLGWRKNFLTTTGAQLAVAPLLAANFGNFSLIGFLTNVLILEAIPITMFLGFLIGLVGFLSLSLALVFGWFTGLFLSYEIGLIKIFGQDFLPTLEIGYFGMVVYYLALVGFVYRQYQKTLPNIDKQAQKV